MAYRSTYTGLEIDKAIGMVNQRASVWDSKQTRLSGTVEQIVGFNEYGDAVAIDADMDFIGGGGKGAPLTRYTCVLSSNGWVDNFQEVEIAEIEADEASQLIQPIASGSSFAEYANCAIIAQQAEGKLIFNCEEVPENDLTVYVIIQPVSDPEQE